MDECPFTPYQSQLLSVAFRWTGNRQDAEDLVQGTFLQAFKSYDQFKGGNLRAWLFRVMKTTLNDTRKRAARFKRPKMSDAGEPKEWQVPRVMSAEDDALNRVIDPRINEALQLLLPESRQTFYLHYAAGWSYEMIAEVQGISENAVGMRLKRARYLFKKTY